MWFQHASTIEGSSYILYFSFNWLKTELEKSGDETAMETSVVVQLRKESRLWATTNKRDNTCAKKKKRIRKRVREERSVSARAGKHASQPGKQVNEWTNELTVGGAATFFRCTYFPRRCHHRSRHSRFNRISEETSDEKKTMKILGTTLTTRVCVAFEPNPKSTYVQPYLLCYWFYSDTRVPEYLWTLPPMIS